MDIAENLEQEAISEATKHYEAKIADCQVKQMNIEKTKKTVLHDID